MSWPGRPDRRAHQRLKASEGAGLPTGRFRSGHDLVLVNLSDGGALLDTHRRVLPGAKVAILLDRDDGPVLAPGQVVRSSVAGVDPESGVTYRVAVRFEHACVVMGRGLWAG